MDHRDAANGFRFIAPAADVPVAYRRAVQTFYDYATQT
jgi:hypothetical protein